MTSRRPLVILNPVAGGGRALEALEPVRAELQENGIDHDLVVCERSWHASELARAAAAEGISLVVAVGGDGTVNEAANGLHSASALPSTALGIVPVGRGNDFVKPLGAPKGRPRESIRRILAGEARAVDLGIAGRRCFVNGLGVGFDGFVVSKTRGSSRLRGTLFYLVALAKALGEYRTADARIEIDGREWLRGPVSMIAVTNGPCHGGGFWICPNAKIDDGYLDIVTADAMGPARLVPLAGRVMRGAHLDHPAVRSTSGREVRIRLSSPLPAHVDGEMLGMTIRDLKVAIAGRIRVLA